MPIPSFGCFLAGGLRELGWLMLDFDSLALEFGWLVRDLAGYFGLGLDR